MNLDKKETLRDLLRNLRPILTIVIIYLLFSIAWILATDQLATILETQYGVTNEIQTYKGIVFVIVSAVILFWLLFRALRRREADYQVHLEETETLLDQLRQKNEELVEAYDRTILGWSRVLEMRSREVKNHSRRVTELSVHLARSMGLDEEDVMNIRRGALLHDIGKMAIPDSIIDKNSDLTEEERALMNKHPLFGFEMLSEIEYLRPAMDLLLCHHEKWNGEGYPFGLSGEQIPLYARIFAVVDVWDALRSERPYHKPEPPEVAIDYLSKHAGEHFDPLVVDAFLRMLQAKPELMRLQEIDEAPLDFQYTTRSRV